MALKNQEIRSLTGLRGIAALYVVLYHFGLYKSFSGSLHSFAIHGYLAVDIFFMLSGFVMAMTYQHFFESGFSFTSYKKFLARRFARIYPLYFFVILISVLFSDKLSHIPLTLLNISSNFLMIQAWGISESYMGPAWSISTEWAVYLLFPLLLTATFFCSQKNAIINSIICFGLLSLLVLLPQEISHVTCVRGLMDMSDGTNYAPLAKCFLEFTIGLLTYRLFKSGSVQLPDYTPPPHLSYCRYIPRDPEQRFIICISCSPHIDCYRRRQIYPSTFSGMETHTLAGDHFIFPLSRSYSDVPYKRQNITCRYKFWHWTHKFYSSRLTNVISHFIGCTHLLHHRKARQTHHAKLIRGEKTPA